MENYNTLLIFGYGQTQLITDLETKLVDSSELQSLNAVIQNVYSNKPVGNKADDTFVRIAIYNNNFADWVTDNPNDYFKVPYDELDSILINNLVKEIKNLNIIL